VIVGRRKLSFAERRQQLAESIDIISNAINELERTGKTHMLRAVANQLRALIVNKPESRSLRHPLLLELANERDYPLTVYSGDAGYLDKITEIAGEKPFFYSSGDALSLDKDEIFKRAISLADAMEELSTTIAGEALTLKEVILHVANTEAAHYDPSTPTILDDLGKIQLGGLPTHYRVIYSLGRLVNKLAQRFLQATT